MGMKCNDCKHRRDIPGDTHSRCTNPDMKHVEGNAHAIRNGWFNYPYNFDPIWGKGCTNFQEENSEVQS